MNGAKIRLSPKELELVTDQVWILTKNDILIKARNLLLGLQEQEVTYLGKMVKPISGEILMSSPKISRGENYKGLPYLVLDYPRVFKQEDIFAIRTMFWWGNFFSITLQLSGHFKKKFAEKIIASHSSWKKNNYFICPNADPWQHHFDENNFLPVNQLTKKDFEMMINDHSFIKLANRIPLQDWEEAPMKLYGYFKQFIEALM